MVVIQYADGSEKLFCEQKCLSAQLKDAKIVNITTSDDSARSANDFLSAFCDLSDFLILKPIEFSVNHGNSIVGARVMKRAKLTNKAVAFRWLVKELVQFHSSIDAKLNDIINDMKVAANA